MKPQLRWLFGLCVGGCGDGASVAGGSGGGSSGSTGSVATSSTGVASSESASVTSAADTSSDDGGTTGGEHVQCPGPIEGYGGMSNGGAGGDVYHVTTLDDAGPGSLRTGIDERTGARTIVFDVAGTITLASELSILAPLITIDGCSAPEPGITITHATGDSSLLGIYGTHDVVVQGLRFVALWQPGEATDEGVKAIGIDGDSGPDQVAANIVLHHLTIAWAGDGAFDLWGEVHDVTLSWTLLHDSARGGLVSHYPGPYQVRQRISYHHNVYSRNTERNPQIRADVRDFDYVNNIVHDWGFHDPASGYGIRIRNDGDEPPVHGNFVGNVFVSTIAPENGFIDEGTGSQLWLMDNRFPPEMLGDPTTLPEAIPVPEEARVTTFPASEVPGAVLSQVGAPWRTEAEQDLLDEILGGDVSTVVRDDERGAWIDAREAIALLGIKRASLYSYASRGWVRSIPGARGRARLYARDDLERLRVRHDARAGHAPLAAAALRFGEPVLDSRITRIDEHGPHVRGLSLVDAASSGMRFEAVADHVLGGTGAWTLTPARARSLATVLARRPAHAQTIDLLPAIVAAAALVPGASDDWPTLARELVVLATATLAARDRGKAILADTRPVAARVQHALGGRTDRPALAAIDAALVVLCEHELNVGTFAVRIAASADAGLHACVGAGLCALGGSRHGRASHRLAELVDEVDRPREAEPVVAARLRRGDALPGFGHPLYPRGDPRAQVLLSQARSLPRASPALRTVLAIVDAAARLGAEPPNVDSGLVALAAALGMPLGTTASGLFAVARIVGWVAHAIEQRDAGVLLRPRARYVGE